MLPSNTTINNKKFKGSSNTITDYKFDAFVALGNIQTRKEIVQGLKIKGAIKFLNIVKPSYGWVYNKLNKLGNGNYFEIGVIGIVNISIGIFNLIIIRCLISHDDVIEPFLYDSWGKEYIGSRIIYLYENFSIFVQALQFSYQAY